MLKSPVYNGIEFRLLDTHPPVYISARLLKMSYTMPEYQACQSPLAEVWLSCGELNLEIRSLEFPPLPPS